MPQSADAPGWPQGNGEMARLIRGHDRAATLMGPLDAWPQSVGTTLDLLLTSGSPMVALWGPDLVQIYNDRCRRIMRHRHPAGLGAPARACWPELCHIGEPLYERVLAGETLTQEDVLCPIDRGGALEDAWFTLSYSPLRDEGGTVMGILVTLIETTAQRLAGRALRKSREQQAFLLQYPDEEGDGSPIVPDGLPGIPLRSTTVQTFALTIPELCTSAMKHGALSRPEGRLEVYWSLVPSRDNGQRLRVEWRESGVPAGSPDGATFAARRQGYGRERIERALPYQLMAQVSYQITSDGVRCLILVPVSSTLRAAFSDRKGPLA